MCNIYHSYFKFWRNFKRKQDFCWVAITKTYPIDYIGSVYTKLAPIGKNFDEVEHPFNEYLFFQEYTKLLKSLDKKEVLTDLKKFSKHNKDIVLLNWEDLHRNSEGRIAYAWLFNLTLKQANDNDLEKILKYQELLKTNLSTDLWLI